MVKAPNTLLPLLRKALSGGLMAFSGDVICQTVEGRNWDDLDTKRTKRFFITGALAGLMFPLWFPFLNRTVVSGHPKLLPVKKVIVHMSIVSPIFICFAIVVLRFAEGLSVQQVHESVKKDFLPTYKNSWKVWPWALLFKYYFLPVRWHAFFLRWVNIGWMTVVSSITQK